jgi:predicted thioesterase
MAWRDNFAGGFVARGCARRAFEKLSYESKPKCFNELNRSLAVHNAAPIIIGWMERTCRDAVLPLLEAGHDTVGTHVDVYHLAATPMGMTVTFKAEVIGVEGRRVNFRVEAWDEKEKCGEGTHERAIVNIARFAAKMQAKLG